MGGVPLGPLPDLPSNATTSANTSSPTGVSEEVRTTFLTEFYTERAKFATTPASEIRGAGRATKANPNGEDELWWLHHGPEMLQRWEDFRNNSGWSVWLTPDGIPAIELEMVEQFEDQLLKVIIDRVFQTETGGLVIFDLKSGSRTPAGDLQLGFGAAVLYLRYGVRVVGGTYWMAREGQCEPVVPLTIWSPKLTAHYARQLQAARREGIYLPHVTNMCRACGVRDYCLAVGGKKSHLDPDYKYTKFEEDA